MNLNDEGGRVLMDPEMLRLVLEEIRAVRHSLEAHVVNEDHQYEALRREVSKVREELAEHKTRLGVISGGIALFIGTVVTFVWNALFGEMGP